ncbi:unnamed protein product [Diatraea saccharalis]|uniref:Uncharacterized protein n=1 Tax=Diatraea saccharalis TaxID=40085 RepID=A0A9N9R633_9NEOP|nr:unnamed protein product [Diatraea saccharalis]
MKSQDKNNEKILDQKENVEENIKNSGSKTNEKQEKKDCDGRKICSKNPDNVNDCDEIENLFKQPSTLKQTFILTGMEPNVGESLEFENMAMDLEIGNEVVIEEYIINETEETTCISECAEKVKPISVSNTSNLATIPPGTTVVFRDEGSLFPGKIVSFLSPYYVIAAMSRSIGGGWRWPATKQMTKIKFDDIVSTVDPAKIKIKSVGVYHLEDDLLFMEWGE